MNIILLGAPGAGKGTQAQFIAKKYGIPTISTGNILREQVALGTELGKAAKKIMDEGGLVGDEIILGMLETRVSQDDAKSGFILDGVPRTIKQAEGIEELGLKIDIVLDIVISDEEVLKRLGGRRYCPECKSTFHVEFDPPKKEGICDKCGESLIIRDDDKEETIKNRLKVYYEQTSPLTSFYEKKGKLISVAGDGAVAQVTENIFKALEGAIK